MGAIVFASTGGRKYHFDQNCKAFQSAQMLSDLDCGCDTYCTHRMPRMHGLVRMSATKAAIDGKLPCLACVPEHLREMPEAETFGHEPFPWPGLPDEAKGNACARCWTGQPVTWPCTSALILGLVPRRAAT